MDTTSTQGVELTAQELYYLAAIQGGDMLLGIDDPFPGWLTEEIAEEMGRVAAALAARGLVALGEDAVVAAPEIAPIVRTMTFPDATLLLTGSTPDGAMEQGAIFLTAESAAELDRTGELSYRLTGFDGPSGAFERIATRWGLNGQPAAGATAVTLPQDVVWQARGQLAGGVEGVAASLQTAGASEAAAQALAETFAAPIRNAAVATVRRGEVAWHTGGIAVLEGASGLWRLSVAERDDMPQVTFTPIDADTLRDELRATLADCLPVAAGANGGGSWTG